MPLILTLVPPRSAISIEPAGGAGNTGGDPPRSSTVGDLKGAISTGSNRTGSADGGPTENCRRHLNSWFVFTS